MEEILLFVKPYIEMLLGQYGQAAQVLGVVILVMGVARVIFKPLMELLKAVASVTKTKKDDEALAKLEGSKAYKVAAFVVDFLFSIKLPAKKAE